MTRDEALLKLLSLEPETKPRLLVVTGWDTEETESVLRGLIEAGKVTYRNGAHGAVGERRYYPVGAGMGAPSMGLRKNGQRVRNRSRQVVRGERALESCRSSGAGQASD